MKSHSRFLVLAVSLMSVVFSIAAKADVSGYHCCIQSAQDDKNGVQHAGKSQYCVSNNSEEMPQTRPGVFDIEKYGYKFQIDLNAPRLQSIAITKPDGSVQTGPEKYSLGGLLADLFIGNFGEPQYQYFSETAMAFTLDCGK